MNKLLVSVIKQRTRHGASTTWHSRPGFADGAGWAHSWRSISCTTRTPLVAYRDPALPLPLPRLPHPLLCAGPTCWLLFGYIFYSQPILRLPLLLYHLWIISPPGRRAVGTSHMPWLARSLPLYWGQARYFAGSRLIKTAELDPSRSYVWAGHPHGLLGNSYFLAFCTDLLGFSKLFPGIRLSIGGC